MSKGIYHQAIRLLQKEGDLDHHSRIMERLVAEIGRLRELLQAAEKRHQYNESRLATKNDAIKSLEYRNHRRQEDFCALKSELARWQQIATDLKADEIQNENSGDFVDARGNHIFQVIDLGKCRERATEELNLQAPQDAGYVDRLEKEFLDVYPYAEIGWSMHGYPIEFSEEERQTAQAALCKIREGKP